ncbi:hypothetical protein nbrc107696_08800 [Gordonia spumicola]|uniref:DUF732 domain-containing protein n=1 Tax=Gordonia spumicola TaxID=589161 RepID=A0A7I9V5H4_9ACTN|nr:hypothetical protein [Gordonia spumicola]GEE00434.1 hypothetical protein nbrc107696_08800 [Gordonia spumicola]
MSVKFFRVLATVGVLLIGATALAACNDSTTASAPIGTEAVTTTSMDPSDASSGQAEASREAEDGASKASVSVPATNPDSSTKVPGNFPGGIPTPSGVPLTDKEKAYLADLKRQNVSFMGDTDNNVALTMGAYVCSQRSQKTDPTMIKAYMRAAIGPMAKSEADAAVKADKVIASADANLC